MKLQNFKKLFKFVLNSIIFLNNYVQNKIKQIKVDDELIRLIFKIDCSL